MLPVADWVIDAAANPSVLAGLPGGCSSRQLFEHNLGALVNVLEYCKAHRAGLVLLSSSRVYSISLLRSLPLKVHNNAFRLTATTQLPPGVSAQGIGPDFSTSAPVSLYGSTKLASEIMALEYSNVFGFPVWIDRCGVLAGPGQFGTPDQGIFSYWLNAHLRQRSLRYIGFEGRGMQVRDAMHPRDLAALLDAQMRLGRAGGQRVYTAPVVAQRMPCPWRNSPPGATRDSVPTRLLPIPAPVVTTSPGWSWTTETPNAISAGG